MRFAETDDPPLGDRQWPTVMGVLCTALFIVAIDRWAVSQTPRSADWIAVIQENPDSLAARRAFRALVHRMAYGTQDAVELRDVAGLLQGSSRQFVIGWQPKFLRGPVER